MDNFAQFDRNSSAVFFVRGSFRPATDAVSRSMLELVLALQRVERPVKIICWTVPDEFPMMEDLEAGTLQSLAPSALLDSYKSTDRLRFMVAATLFLLKRVKSGSSVVTLEDPTGLGLCVLPLKMLRRRVRHIAYLMDLQSVQYLRLGHGAGLTSLANRIRGALDTLSWRCADAVVVLGECMRAVVQELEPRATVVVIPIWQDPDRIYRVDGGAARELLNLNDRLVVLYHGHATYRQPMDVILSAAQQISSSSNVCFVVVGGGPSVAWLQTEVDGLGLDNVQVYSKVQGAGMLEVLSMADVHLAILDERATGTCVPSKTYTAMAVGRPCVYIGDYAGQAAVDLEASRGGYVVSGRDGVQLVDRLDQLAGESDREEMGQRGLQYFLAERGLDQAAIRWIEILG